MDANKRNFPQMSITGDLPPAAAESHRSIGCCAPQSTHGMVASGVWQCGHIPRVRNASNRCPHAGQSQMAPLGGGC